MSVSSLGSASILPGSLACCHLLARTSASALRLLRGPRSAITTAAARPHAPSTRGDQAKPGELTASPPSKVGETGAATELYTASS